MRWLVDVLYLGAALLTSPIWAIRMTRTGKIRTDWRGRFGRTAPLRPRIAGRRRILLHAVSVGEVNAIRLLVDELAAAGGVKVGGASPELVIATTTDTGFARAKGLWGDRHSIVRYPLDFSFCVNRFLRSIQPDIVVLVELEVWPNFTAACARRSTPVIVVNGRLTERSFRRYRRLGPLVRPMFARLAGVAAQNQAYADRFHALGTPVERIQISGTMKWDTAKVESPDEVAGAEELARGMGIDRAKPLIVAGSTAPEEHKLVLAATPPGVQLLCAPRKPEWFDQAAVDLPGCVRRSEQGRRNVETSKRQNNKRLFLLDTIGELRQAYALADVVVVGRSFGNLHGSDMMEPVALGKATIVGSAVGDFQDTVAALLAGDGVVQTTAGELPRVINALLADPKRRCELAANGRAVIRANQGVTQRNVKLIVGCMKMKG